MRELASAYAVIQKHSKSPDDGFLIDRSEEIRFERTKCVDCGICVRTLEEAGKNGSRTMKLLVERCPTGALSG